MNTSISPVNDILSGPYGEYAFKYTKGFFDDDFNYNRPLLEWRGIDRINNLLSIKQQTLSGVLYLRDPLIQSGRLTLDQFFKVHVTLGSCCDDFIKTQIYRRGSEYRENFLDGYFCGHSLCPICLNFNLYKIQQSIVAIIDEYRDNPEFDFYFLTMGIPEKHFKDVGNALSQLQKNWAKFSQYRVMKKHMVGYFRSMAVAPVPEDEDLRFDESRYYLHLHCIIAIKVNPSFNHQEFQNDLEIGWLNATKGEGSLDARRILPFNEYLECESPEEDFSAEEILSRTKETDGLNRTIKYLLNQNNPYCKDVPIHRLVKYLSVRLSNPKKRWNYSRGGLFRGSKIKSFKPTHSRLKYKPEILRSEDGIHISLGGRGTFRAVVNLRGRVSPARNTVGERYFHLLSIDREPGN